MSRRRPVFALAVAFACLTLPASASALATLSGQVYYDPPSGPNVPVPGVVVAIKTAFDAPVKTATTAANGTWSTTVYGGSGFDYKVYVPNTYAPISPASGWKQVTAIDAQTTANINFSVKGSTLTGTVFNDVDKDATKQAQEPGLGGAGVTIDGPVDASVTTNASGAYTSGAPVLPAGTYAITAAKAGYDASTPVRSASPTAGANATVADFGLAWPTGTVSGDAYAETNATPGRQAGEPPIAGVPVTVTGAYDGQSFTLSTSSGADGTWTLPVFAGADRTVSAQQPAAYADGPEFTAVPGAVVGADAFTSVTVAANTATGAFQFGETGASIAGVTFSDRDAEGQRDAGEPGTGGRAIAVTATGFSQTITSDADGAYVVKGLPAGDVTLTPAATTDALAPAAVTLHPGVAESLSAKHLGYRFASLAGSVVNRQTGAGVGDVSVALSGDASRTVTTAADGSWAIYELSPGAYALQATPPAGLLPAPSTAGTLGGAAGDAAVTGIGAGLAQLGSGYVLGLAPAPAPQGGVTQPQGQGQGQSQPLVATKVTIVAGKRTSVRRARLKLGCRLNAGQVKTCSFVVRTKRGKILARGKATARTAAKALSAKLTLTKLGRRQLARHPRRLAGVAEVKATQAAGAALKARKTLKMHRAR